MTESVKGHRAGQNIKQDHRVVFSYFLCTNISAITPYHLIVCSTRAKSQNFYTKFRQEYVLSFKRVIASKCPRIVNIFPKQVNRVSKQARQNAKRQTQSATVQRQWPAIRWTIKQERLAAAAAAAAAAIQAHD